MGELSARARKSHRARYPRISEGSDVDDMDVVCMDLTDEGPAARDGDELSADAAAAEFACVTLIERGLAGAAQAADAGQDGSKTRQLSAATGRGRRRRRRRRRGKRGNGHLDSSRGAHTKRQRQRGASAAPGSPVHRPPASSRAAYSSPAAHRAAANARGRTRLVSGHE